jgi:hypothetical protein
LREEFCNIGSSLFDRSSSTGTSTKDQYAGSLNDQT